MDELNIQENLERDKHNRELIGYVDLNYATLSKVTISCTGFLN